MSKDKKEEKKQTVPAADEIKEEVKTEEPEIEAKEADGKKPEAETAEEKKPVEKKGKDKKEEKKPDLKAEMDALNDKYLRICAEYDNFRKRSARERDNIYADVKADTLKKLLPIFDNLERALRQETADEAYKKGVEMTMTQFLEALQALGVTPIEAVGQKFDPNEHNAVMHMEDPEKGEGEIVQEFQKGFKMGDRVIRFSMVQVAN